MTVHSPQCSEFSKALLKRVSTHVFEFVVEGLGAFMWLIAGGTWVKKPLLLYCNAVSGSKAYAGLAHTNFISENANLM